MGKWKEQQEIKKESRDKDKSRRENLAKFFFDLSKLCFAGLVIGGVFPLFTELSKLENWYIILMGIITTICFAYIANKMF